MIGTGRARLERSSPLCRIWLERKGAMIVEVWDNSRRKGLGIPTLAGP